MTPSAAARPTRARPPVGPRLPWLRAGAGALGIGLSPDQLAAFDCYRDALLTANRHTNLTAITDPAAVEMRHFVDSLTCLLAWPAVTDRPMQVIDIGAGAGFPGLPLKLLRPPIGLALVDSVGKKTAFLADLVHHLNLEAVTVVTARAEDLARQPAYREQYDVALARAVAPAPVLVEYTLPFLRIGGRLIAQKTTRKGQSELAACQRACALLGGGPPRLVPVVLSSPSDPLAPWPLAPWMKARSLPTDHHAADRHSPTSGNPPLPPERTLAQPGPPATPGPARYLAEAQQALSDRALLVVEKQHPTPDRYPRRAGIPAKRPL